MKRFLLLAISIFFTHTAAAICDPLLAVVLMVKNEESVIVASVEPYVQGGIDAFFIYDTGSTDKTIERISDYFQQKGITNAAIVQEEFVDFATSRNRALDLAQERFPNAGFLLMPDAEWYLKNADQLLTYCKNEIENGSVDEVYSIHTGNDTTDFDTSRLFKGDTKVRFVGSVHECPNYVSRKTLPAEIYFHWAPSAIGNKKSQARWHRDLNLLLKDYQINPKNPRTVFYLAQTYECLGNDERAAHYYKERAELDMVPEETFMAWYRLALVTQRLAERKQADMHQAIGYYLKAYSYRPWRAEPIICLARYYLNQDNHQMAYHFAKAACDIPYPSNDYLFIDKNLYNYERYDILSHACWYVGDFQKGQWASEMAINARPNPYDHHLYLNLGLYRGRLSAQQ